MGLRIGELVLTVNSVLPGESFSISSIPFFSIGDGKFFFNSGQVFSNTRLFNRGTVSCLKPVEKKKNRMQYSTHIILIVRVI